MNRIRKENELLFTSIVEQIQQEYQVQGLGIMIVDKSGEIQYETYFGYRDSDRKLPIDQDTIFGIASCTKSFTCLAIMQMQQEGKLCVDDPVSNYIPEFTNKNQSEPVRIRHLMCHSGGFFPLPRIVVDQVAGDLGLDEARDGDLAYHDGLAQEGVRRVAGRLDAQTVEHGLNGRPGEYFSYCNDGFGLLSDIIRRFGGEPSFADYLNRHVLAPLQMTRSGCDFVKPSVDENAAILYEKRSGEMRGHRDYHDNAFVLNGGGAMKSTLDDLRKYLCMYLNGGVGLNGKRILDEYSVREMSKPHQRSGFQSYYGYGFSLKTMDDLNIVEHGGSLPGVSSNIAWSNEAGAAVIVLCNTSDVPVSLISDAAMKMYCGRNPISVRGMWQTEPWSMETVQKACGMYVSGEGTMVQLYQKEDGTIGMRVEGKDQNILTVNPTDAIIRRKMTDGYLRLCMRGGEVFAIAYGSRMIPKAGVCEVQDC